MNNEPNPAALNSEQWAAKLAEIASHLELPASLCLIGSAAGMFSQQQRVSIDLDVWQKRSQFFYSDLKQACEKSGLLFNPKDEMEPNVAYIQLIDPGMVQIGDFDKTEPILRERNLVVERPPIENIIASKLVRMSEKDLEDVAFLVKRFGVTKEAVETVIQTFPRGHTRDQAVENLVYLDVLEPPDHSTPDI
jgi:hypothetical protein